MFRFGDDTGSQLHFSIIDLPQKSMQVPNHSFQKRSKTNACSGYTVKDNALSAQRMSETNGEMEKMSWINDELVLILMGKRLNQLSDLTTQI